MGVTEKAIERRTLVAADRYVVLAADTCGQGMRPADFGAAAQPANPRRAARSPAASAHRYRR